MGMDDITQSIVLPLCAVDNCMSLLQCGRNRDIIKHIKILFRDVAVCLMKTDVVLWRENVVTNNHIFVLNSIDKKIVLCYNNNMIN